MSMQTSLRYLLFCLNATTLYRRETFDFMRAGRKISTSKSVASNGKSQCDSRTVYNQKNGHSHSTAPPTILTGASGLNKPQIYHQNCPVTPTFTALGFEIFYFVYGFLALLSQYVNIYKTNYHLIDYQEVLVIALFLLRRIGWIIFNQIVFIKEITSVGIVCSALFKGFTLTILMAAFVTLLMQLYRTTSFTNIMLFLYPTLTYVLLFGFTMELKLQRVTPKVIHQTAYSREKVLSKDPIGNTSNAEDESGWKHRHCTLSPDVIRSEAEGHRVDFNFKMKRVLFQSFICAYYVGFIPMKFSKRFYVYYDLWWSCQHVVLVWIGSLVLLMKYFVPLHYCNTLSMCAVHLGAWVECDEEEDEIPKNPRDWSALTSWPRDTIVNYKNKRYYKSLGMQNVADPGDVHHCRFYFVFHSPTRLTNWLLFTLSVIVFYQLVMLCRSPLWHEVVSLCLPLLLNYVVLYKLLRDRWVAMATELKPT